MWEGSKEQACQNCSSLGMVLLPGQPYPHTIRVAPRLLDLAGFIRLHHTRRLKCSCLGEAVVPLSCGCNILGQFDYNTLSERKSCGALPGFVSGKTQKLKARNGSTGMGVGAATPFRATGEFWYRLFTGQFSSLSAFVGEVSVKEWFKGGWMCRVTPGIPLLCKRRMSNFCGQEMDSRGCSVSISKGGFLPIPLARHSETLPNATGQILFSVTPMQPY